MSTGSRRTYNLSVFNQLGFRLDRSIIEKLQDIVVPLKAQLHPLVQEESSVIVDVLNELRKFGLLPLQTNQPHCRPKCSSSGRHPFPPAPLREPQPRPEEFPARPVDKSSYNLVSDTLMFLDCIGGSTTG